MFNFFKKSGGAKEPLVGERAHERSAGKEQFQDLRLSEGTPLYYALLENADAPAIDKDEVQKAKSELSRLAEVNPEAVRNCEGKSIDEARDILRSIGEKQEAA